MVKESSFNKSKAYKNFLIIFISFWYVVQGFAQINLTLKNEADGLVLGYAPIKYTSLNNGKTLHAISNELGEIKIPNSHTPIAVYIAYLGFETYKDTFKINGAFTIQLKPDIKYLPEAVITDQYAATRPERSINKIIVIDEKKIKSLAANNLNELLTNQLNVKLTQDNILGGTMSLMGISGQNVKLLIDGVPIIGRQNGNIDLAQINLNDIERIEIIEGPSSVAYGTNALAGAINIITKKKQLHKTTLGLTSYTENIGRYNLNFNLGMRHKNGVYHFSGGRNYFDGWSNTATIRFQDWKPKEQYFGRFQYVRKIGLFDFVYKSEAFHEKLTNKGWPREPYFETAFDEYYFTKRWDNAIAASAKLPKNRNLNIIAAYNIYSRIKNRYLFDRVTLKKELVPETNEQDTTQFNAIVMRGTYSKSLVNSKFNYQIGYDINSETGHGKKLKDQKNSISDFASFLSMEINPIKNLQLKPGFRYSYNTAYTTIPLPSFNFKYNSKKNITWRGSYARGFRAPDLKELYLFFVDVNHNISGNPALSPERSNNFQISLLKKLIKKSNWYQPEASIFVNTITDRIILANIQNASYTYLNLDYFKSITFNTALNYKIKALTGNLGMAYNIVSLQKLGFGNAFNSYEINSACSYTYQKYGLTISCFVKLNSKAQNFIINEIGQANTTVIPSYTWADFNISKSFYHQKYIISLGSKNLFNIKNISTNGNGGAIHNGNSNSLQIGMGRIYFIKFDLNLSKK